MPRKVLTLLICFTLIFEQAGFAQVAGQIPVPAYLNNLLLPDRFHPVHLRALVYNPLNKNFDLFLDKGDVKDAAQPVLEAESQKFFEYFQIGLALPNNTFWVNLRPDAPTDIIDAELEKTDVGRIMLAADLQLKKDIAMFTSPDTAEGREYWNKLYAKIDTLYGAEEDVEIPTMTRPWIVPGEIIIGEAKDGAYIYKATLKVMLEQDYLKDAKQAAFGDARVKELNDYSSELIRQLIIPKLARTVNSSKKYAELRQVYYSLILAQWFKGKAGAQATKFDSKDLTGLTSKQAWQKEAYFQSYKKSFAEGEYHKEENVNSPYGVYVRQYTSGGMNLGLGNQIQDGGRITVFKLDTIMEKGGVEKIGGLFVRDNIVQRDGGKTEEEFEKKIESFFANKGYSDIQEHGSTGAHAITFTMKDNAGASLLAKVEDLHRIKQEDLNRNDNEAYRSKYAQEMRGQLELLSNASFKDGSFSVLPKVVDLGFMDNILLVTDAPTNAPVMQGQYYYMIMDYFAGEDVGELLKLKVQGGKEYFKNVSLESLLPALIQFVSGVKSLHDAGFVHRELFLDRKPRNILYGNNEFKIVDLDALASSRGRSAEEWKELVTEESNQVIAIVKSIVSQSAFWETSSFQGADIRTLDQLLQELGNVQESTADQENKASQTKRDGGFDKDLVVEYLSGRTGSVGPGANRTEKELLLRAAKGEVLTGPEKEQLVTAVRDEFAFLLRIDPSEKVFRAPFMQWSEDKSSTRLDISLRGKLKTLMAIKLLAERASDEDRLNYLSATGMVQEVADKETRKFAESLLDSFRCSDAEVADILNGLQVRQATRSVKNNEAMSSWARLERLRGKTAFPDMFNAVLGQYPGGLRELAEDVAINRMPQALLLMQEAPKPDAIFLARDAEVKKSLAAELGHAIGRYYLGAQRLDSSVNESLDFLGQVFAGRTVLPLQQSSDITMIDFAMAAREISSKEWETIKESEAVKQITPEEWSEMQQSLVQNVKLQDMVASKDLQFWFIAPEFRVALVDRLVAMKNESNELHRKALEPRKIATREATEEIMWNYYERDHAFLSHATGEVIARELLKEAKDKLDRGLLKRAEDERDAVLGIIGFMLRERKGVFADEEEFRAEFKRALEQGDGFAARGKDSTRQGPRRDGGEEKLIEDLGRYAPLAAEVAGQIMKEESFAQEKDRLLRLYGGVADIVKESAGRPGQRFATGLYLLSGSDIAAIARYADRIITVDRNDIFFPQFFTDVYDLTSERPDHDRVEERVRAYLGSKFMTGMHGADYGPGLIDYLADLAIAGADLNSLHLVDYKVIEAQPQSILQATVAFKIKDRTVTHTHITYNFDAKADQKPFLKTLGSLIENEKDVMVLSKAGATTQGQFIAAQMFKAIESLLPDKTVVVSDDPEFVESPRQNLKTQETEKELTNLGKEFADASAGFGYGYAKVPDLGRVSIQQVGESVRRDGGARKEQIRGRFGATALKAVFSGDVWIHAGSYAYKLWIADGLVRFQRHDSKNGISIGSIHSFPMGRTFTVGRQRFNHYILDDANLASVHFVFSVQPNGNGEYTLVVEDYGSQGGTVVEWVQPSRAENQQPAFEIGEKVGPYGHGINGGVSTGRNNNREIIKVSWEEDQNLQKLYEETLRVAGITENDVDLFNDQKGDLLETIFKAVTVAIQYNGFVPGHQYGNQILVGDTIETGGTCRHMGIVSAAILERLIQKGILKGQVYYIRGNGHGWAVYTTSGRNFVVFDVAQNYLGELAHPYFGGEGLTYKVHMPSEILNQPRRNVNPLYETQPRGVGFDSENHLLNLDSFGFIPGKAIVIKKTGKRGTSAIDAGFKEEVVLTSNIQVGQSIRWMGGNTSHVLPGSIKKIGDGRFGVETGTSDYEVSLVDGALGTTKDGGLLDRGGIDFRALPLSTQPAGVPISPAVDMQMLRTLAQGSKIQDLDQAWQGIQQQAQKETTLPYQKIKEYIAVCCQRDAGKNKIDEVSAYLAQVLRLEEDSAVATAPELKELLVLVESIDVENAKI